MRNGLETPFALFSLPKLSEGGPFIHGQLLVWRDSHSSLSSWWSLSHILGVCEILRNLRLLFAATTSYILFYASLRHSRRLGYTSLTALERQLWHISNVYDDLLIDVLIRYSIGLPILFATPAVLS